MRLGPSDAGLAHLFHHPRGDPDRRVRDNRLTMQIEALKRYRTGGRQTVTVEHVTVNAGGQAIVGNVETGGRGTSKKSGPTP